MDEIEKLKRTIELLHAYGEARLGDDWWPGNAKPHLGEEKGGELEALLDN